MHVPETVKLSRNPLKTTEQANLRSGVATQAAEPELYPEKRRVQSKNYRSLPALHSKALTILLMTLTNMSAE